MHEVLPDSETARHVGPRRQASIRASAPDWLFSAVVHLLLFALLFTSKSAPGRGGGDGGPGQGGNGVGDFPGDGWIEAQIGSESTFGGTAAVTIESMASTVPAPESHPVPSTADPNDVPGETADAIVQTGFTEAADATPPSAVADATASTATGSISVGSGRPDGPTGGAGNAGLGRGVGDGSPGDGGHGQGEGGSSLFGIWDSGERIVYVIDRSSSMGHYEKLVAARQELEASLARLDESFEFQVLYYNQQVQPLSVRGARGLIRASAVNKLQVRRQIGLVAADGGTRHRAALQAALDLRPTVIYFLTDAEDDGLTPAEIATLAHRLRETTRIHCIQFGDMPGESPTAGNWLEQLAAATGGQYVHFRTAALQSADGGPPSPR